MSQRRFPRSHCSLRRTIRAGYVRAETRLSRRSGFAARFRHRGQDHGEAAWATCAVRVGREQRAVRRGRAARDQHAASDGALARQPAVSRPARRQEPRGEAGLYLAPLLGLCFEI